MNVQIWNAGAFDANSELSPDRLMPLKAKVSEKAGNELVSYEKSILDDIDSYMEELNDRLTVSRMVTDSVIKGIVYAIEQECAEKISLKDKEVANLNNKLQNHEAISAGKFLLDQLLRTEEKSKMNVSTLGENLEFSHLTFKASAINHIERVNRLRIEAEEQIHKLKEEIGNAKRGGLSQADALCVEVGQCRNYFQTEDIHKFHIVDGLIHSLETLLTEMSTYLGTIISSDKALTFEHKSEKDIPIDISTSMLQNLITGLHHEYETLVLDQKALMNDLKQKWQRKSDALATLRLELDDMYKSLVSWEPGLMFPHISHEISEERNALKRKDKVHRKPVGNNMASHDENRPIVMDKNEDSEKPINADSPQLMCMTKEELIGYFKTEMFKMKRQHEVALEEKTEELFSLKREFLKERGSSHLNFKKDKDLELMRKRIAETVSKLDAILLENENLSTICDDEGLCSLREKFDAIFLENQRLASLLASKKKETTLDNSKVFDTSNQLPNAFVGVEYVDQIEKLQWDMEALKFETSIKDMINESGLRELFGELGNSVDDMEMETKTDQFTYSFILGEVVRDVISRMNNVMMKCYEEKNSVSENLLEKEKALRLEVEENRILKQQIKSSSTLLKTKEILASELEAALTQRTQQIDSIFHERDVLRDHVIKQELIIAESKKESDLINCRLEENFHHIHQYQAEIIKINQKLKIISVALQDAEKQKSNLQSELLENQARLASKIRKEKEQRQQVELILTCMLQLWKSFEELEHKIKYLMDHTESRLKVLSSQSDELSQQASLLKRNLLWYNEVFERRCEDFKKAETEVDLLGDEVDNLVSLLGKIYLALEHYSSVLQYYPGVMETLKLIRREIKGEDSKSF